MNNVFVPRMVGVNILKDRFSTLDFDTKVKLSKCLGSEIKGVYINYDVISGIFGTINSPFDPLFTAIANIIKNRKGSKYFILFDGIDISNKIRNIKAIRGFLRDDKTAHMNPIMGLESGLKECKEFIESGTPFGPFSIDQMRIVKASLVDAIYKTVVK